MRILAGIRVGVLLFSLFLCGASSAVRAEMLQAPNSIVALDLPDGFKASARFSGFEHAASGASIVIAELPGEAFASLESGFSAERLAERGITLVERRKTARDGEHMFIHARQKAAGMDFEKLFLVFQGGGKTLLVSSNIPRSAVVSGQLTLGQIEKSLVSATVRDRQTILPLFEITRPGRLKAADAIAGMTQSFTLSGRLVPGADGAREDLVLIVAPSLDSRSVPDVKSFAMEAFKGVTRDARVSFGASGPVKVGGLDGFEISASAPASAEPGYEKYYQIVLLAPGGGYFRVVGMSKGPDAEQLIGEAKAAAGSFVLKR